MSFSAAHHRILRSRSRLAALIVVLALIAIVLAAHSSAEVDHLGGPAMCLAMVVGWAVARRDLAPGGRGSALLGHFRLLSVQQPTAAGRNVPARASPITLGVFRL